MISPKYKEIYDCFIDHYKMHHVNPWHEISEQELNDLYNNIVNSQDINDDYSFYYLMNKVCKNLDGIYDAHTRYYEQGNGHYMLPMNFKIIENEILVNFPDNLRGYRLISINGIDINEVISIMDEMLIYGTDGRKQFEIESTIINRQAMFGLPIFRNQDKLSYKFLSLDGQEVTKDFYKEEIYPDKDRFNMEKYLYGNPGTYSERDNNLIITHSSSVNKYSDVIQKMVDDLSQKDLTNIDTIIVDIRGNTGGNSQNNNALMDFLRNSGKKVICLTDYKVFSAGRYALIDLINLGALTMGTEISTPLNCYGNCSHKTYDNRVMSVSDSYLAPNYGIYVRSKEEFKERITPEIYKPVFFKPDIYVEQSKEDFINGKDTTLEYALDYIKNKRTL
jgi:hypothetical protein